MKLFLRVQNPFCANVLNRFCGGLIVLIILTGCSSKSKNAEVPLMQVTPEEIVQFQPHQIYRPPLLIRTALSDKRPGWIHKASYKEAGALYYVGAFFKGADYAVTLRCATAEATKALVGSISQFIKAEFSTHASGTNTPLDGIERHIEDGLAMITHNLHVQGASLDETFYEEIYDPEIKQVYFNIWVKIKIDESDYLAAKRSVVRQLKNHFKASEKSESDKAQAILNRLQEHIHALL